MLKKIDFILLSLATISFIEAKDYDITKNGNVNLSVIDGKVIVDGKVVKSIPKGEPIELEINSTNISINKEEIKRDIALKIDENNISVDINSMLKTAQEVQNSKDTKEEKDFFNGDDFFK